MVMHSRKEIVIKKQGRYFNACVSRETATFAEKRSGGAFLGE